MTTSLRVFAVVLLISVTGCSTSTNNNFCDNDLQCSVGEQVCDVESRLCVDIAERDVTIDADVTAPDATEIPADSAVEDAGVDAPMKEVGCVSDEQCTPANKCLQAGTCNPEGICEFEAVVCPAQTVCQVDAPVCNPESGICEFELKEVGTTCAASSTVCESQDTCAFPSNVCARQGTLNCKLTTRTCDVSGSCTAKVADTTKTCSRNTDGVTCQSSTKTGCNGCIFPHTGTCEQQSSGSETCQSCTTSVCGGGVCNTTSTVCEKLCSRICENPGGGAIAEPEVPNLCNCGPALPN